MSACRPRVAPMGERGQWVTDRDPGAWTGMVWIRPDTDVPAPFDEAS